MINRMISRIVPHLPQKLVWIISRKYIAGKKLEDAIRVVQELNSSKILATIDVLGESVNNKEQATDYCQQYLNAITQSAQNKLETTFSLKPSMFGLLWDFKYCVQLIGDIVNLAARYNYFVRIDMEDSTCTDSELRLFELLYNEYPSNIGIAIQAYLKRSLNDIAWLSSITQAENPVNIRICKGIYSEPEEIAFKKEDEIHKNFLDCLELIIKNGLFPAIATHHNYLIERSLELLLTYKKKKNEYEFQMLYGVTPVRRDKLVDSDHTMRVYVPFGDQWFAYSTRRIYENPKMVNAIVEGVFVRR